VRGSIEHSYTVYEWYVNSFTVARVSTWILCCWHLYGFDNIDFEILIATVRDRTLFYSTLLYSNRSYHHFSQKSHFQYKTFKSLGPRDIRLAVRKIQTRLLLGETVDKLSHFCSMEHCFSSTSCVDNIMTAEVEGRLVWLLCCLLTNSSLVYGISGWSKRFVLAFGVLKN